MAGLRLRPTLWMAALVCLPAMVLSIATSSLAQTPGSPADPYEPNDSFTQAAYLENNASSKYGYIWPAEDEDWFWFHVPEGGAHRIEAWLDSVPPGADYRLAVFQPDGDLLGESRRIDDPEQYLSLQVGRGGDYRVRIWSANVGEAWDAYRIRVLVSPIPSADLVLRVRNQAVLGPYPVSSYQLVIQNRGPDPATALTVVITLPPGMVYGGAAASGAWTCSQQHGRVQCSHPGPLAAGGSLPAIWLRVYHSNSGNQEGSMIAWVNSVVFDPALDNNRVIRRVP